MRAGMSVHGGCGRSPYVNWEIKNERMKRYIFCISLCLGVVSGGRAAAQEPPAEPEAALPLLEVKTNALYWTTASLNAGFEMGLTPRITFEIDAGYNPWTFSDNRKFNPKSGIGSATVSKGIFWACIFCMPISMSEA